MNYTFQCNGEFVLLDDEEFEFLKDSFIFLNNAVEKGALKRMAMGSSDAAKFLDKEEVWKCKLVCDAFSGEATIFDLGYDVIEYMILGLNIVEIIAAVLAIGSEQCHGVLNVVENNIRLVNKIRGEFVELIGCD